MEKKDTYIRKPRRKLDTKSITIPDCSLSARVLIDRCAKGLPVNAKMSKHIPLPADGNIDDDWDTGTEEILDVTDAVAFHDKLIAEQKYIQEQKEKARQEAIEAPPVDSAPTE